MILFDNNITCNKSLFEIYHILTCFTLVTYKGHHCTYIILFNLFYSQALSHFCSNIIFRQTAERVDRPLSRIRPEVIPLEAKEMKETSHAASR